MRFTSSAVLVGLVVGCGPTPAESIVDDLETVSVVPVQNTGAGGGASTAPVTTRFASLPVSCWASPDSTCHPVTNEGCAANQLCLLTNTAPERVGLRCIDVTGTRSISQTCSLQTGPYCQAGLWCNQGACRPVCCSSADCVGGQSCLPIDARLGSFGFCGAAQNQCRRSGAACRSNSECCSRDCHVDHCH
jgi:hypothetical protein